MVVDKVGFTQNMKFYLTIDVESCRGDYEGEVCGRGYGLPSILRVLEEHREKAGRK